MMSACHWTKNSLPVFPANTLLFILLIKFVKSNLKIYLQNLEAIIRKEQWLQNRSSTQEEIQI